MTQPSLRVASYNIRKGVGIDRRRRPERNLDVLNRIGADLVAVQEADRRLGNRPAALTPEMVATATDFVPVAAGGHETSIGWHGNALLIRRSLSVLDARGLDLPGLEPRGALVVELEGASRFTVVATHLGLMRASRQAQLKAILAALGAQPSYPVIMLGDFNEWSPSRGFEPLDGAFDVHSPGKSFHARYPLAGLDRIALTRGTVLEDAGVEQGGEARVASDHLPVWADLSLAAPA